MEQLKKEDLDTLVDLMVGIKKEDWTEKNLVLRLILALSEDSDNASVHMDEIYSHLRISK